MKSRLLILLLCVPLLAAFSAKSALTPDTRSALDHITAANLRSNLSFLASDALQGRDTPSHELDIAAEFIASQFRRVGLQPAGDDGFFQTAKWVMTDRPMDGFEMKFEDGSRTLPVAAQQISAQPTPQIDLARIPTWKVDLENVEKLTQADAQGKALVIVTPDVNADTPAKRLEILNMLNRVHLVTTVRLKPALVITFQSGQGGGSRRRRLKDPAEPEGPPAISIYRDSPLYEVFTAMKPGLSPFTVSLRLPPLQETPVTLRNVVGILPGSDPVLKDSYILVTAHYDHIGTNPQREGDQIFNGANDDGSGTVSVIEIANGLATLKNRPKRSIIFMTFFGEEKGLLGSRYYGRRPVFPIEKTVADVNLEQLGRTDSTEGPQVANMTFTGFDYSTLPSFFATAGQQTGVTAYKNPANSDSYFGRSDNQALADAGVPAHTVCVAFNFKDYHGVGDEWQKIDYDNMAKVDRTLALGLIMLANSPQPPHWDESNPKAERYVKAWKERHPQ